MDVQDGGGRDVVDVVEHGRSGGKREVHARPHIVEEVVVFAVPVIEAGAHEKAVLFADVLVHAPEVIAELEWFGKVRLNQVAGAVRLGGAGGRGVDLDDVLGHRVETV